MPAPDGGMPASGAANYTIWSLLVQRDLLLSGGRAAPSFLGAKIELRQRNKIRQVRNFIGPHLRRAHPRIHWLPADKTSTRAVYNNQFLATSTRTVRLKRSSAKHVQADRQAHLASIPRRPTPQADKQKRNNHDKKTIKKTKKKHGIEHHPPSHQAQTSSTTTQQRSVEDSLSQSRPPLHTPLLQPLWYRCGPHRSRSTFLVLQRRGTPGRCWRNRFLPIPHRRAVDTISPCLAGLPFDFSVNGRRGRVAVLRLLFPSRLFQHGSSLFFVRLFNHLRFLLVRRGEGSKVKQSAVCGRATPSVGRDQSGALLRAV